MNQSMIYSYDLLTIVGHESSLNKDAILNWSRLLKLSDRSPRYNRISTHWNHEEFNSCTLLHD